MIEMEQILSTLEIVGVIAFSISGAMAAIDNKLDLFGVIFLGIMASLGGGITRDILIGKLPPQMFSNYRCIIFIFVIRMLSTYFKWDLPKIS